MRSTDLAASGVVTTLCRPSNETGGPLPFHFLLPPFGKADERWVGWTSPRRYIPIYLKLHSFAGYPAINRSARPPPGSPGRESPQRRGAIMKYRAPKKPISRRLWGSRIFNFKRFGSFA